ncbi:DUF1997 domain-containing protein [Lyngbya confervoides]|uniref:DUF1997 domain-containing protein n=1 Tax=Lyngbya confervoides BDU141951 TaxID=1574623 RepID=A0ABD4T6H6_9CYAN|nr:DUF1997 domain-containing protein [Lyngbya confervoides]MCM1983845.1 DUF1997 domain-containing protein [Lyngbya confervoides BDU141951]
MQPDIVCDSLDGTRTLTKANHPDSATRLSPWVGFIPQVAATEDGVKPSPTRFRSTFEGVMELRGDRATVMTYLDAHQGWFCRCAQPMQVHPLGDNGYEIVVGRYGSHGFEVEPRIGLHLLPQEAGVYRIETLDLGEGSHQCYQVDFNASLELVEDAGSHPDNPLTRVEWVLDLGVALQFPKFIHRLPQKLIQYTGDQVLAQIVRQVSKRLTAKVQDDFHRTQLA